MSFADVLRGPVTPVVAATPKRFARQHIHEGVSLDGQLRLAERIVAYLNDRHGVSYTNAVLENIAGASQGSQPSRGSPPSNAIGEEESEGIIDLVASDDDAESHGLSAKTAKRLPYGFWKEIMQEELGLRFTHRKRLQLYRALKVYALRKKEGCQTRLAMRGLRKGRSLRSSGGAENSAKATGLGFALLQYFVDMVQRLSCRADSMMLMNRARELRVELLSDPASRWSETDLPKLIGNAGHQWFLRWRKKYGITKKVIGMKLKVAYRKVKRRVLVLLQNIFRLRAFWEICHPGKVMRWLSADQKPSWFNNAGLTGIFAMKGGSQPRVKENFAHTRQRYTVFTAVPRGWRMIDHPDGVPKVALLFKAAPGGSIIRDLEASAHLKPWMKVQVQREGSYRSEDVVEALDWMLPQARSQDESIIVLLDWFSGHLTEEVAALVRSKGHVLLFHGGGTTPFTQINDTHLHAQLQRLLISYENMVAEEKQRKLAAKGVKKMPSATRKDLVDLVQCVWIAGCGLQ